jgi:hypothetical protein
MECPPAPDSPSPAIKLEGILPEIQFPPPVTSAQTTQTPQPIKEQPPPNVELKTQYTLTIQEGVTSSPGEKLNGGRDNKQALPRHVVGATIQPVLPNSTKPSKNSHVATYYVVAKLLGKKNKLEYSEVETLEQVPLRQESQSLWTATFDNMIVQFASHNFGRKLFVRFLLFEGESKNPLTYCDTASFETITRRGTESRGT